MQKIIKIGPIVSEKNNRTHTRTDGRTDRGQIIDLFLYQKIGQKLNYQTKLGQMGTELKTKLTYDERHTCDFIMYLYITFSLLD